MKYANAEIVKFKRNFTKTNLRGFDYRVPFVTN